MTRFVEKQKAIRLRKNGATYSEIIEKIHVPKSTLSNWLRNFPQKPKQIEKLEKRIKNNKQIAAEKTAAIKRIKRQKRLDLTYKNEGARLLPLSDRELFLCGLFLYWGEGRKDFRGAISLNNTDPKVIKFYLKWLIKALKIPKEKIKVTLHLYQDMDIKSSINFWCKYLNFPMNQFNKPYIKKSTLSNLTHKGFTHGTCGLYINNSLLKGKIILGIQAIADYYTD